MTTAAATKPIRHRLSGDVSGAFADGAELPVTNIEQVSTQ